MNKKKVLVISVALGGYSLLFRDCLRTQRDYCRKFGYEYLLIDKSPRNLVAYEAAWLKLFLLKEALKCHYQWVAFIDADCEVRKHAPSFVDDLGSHYSESIFMAHGFSGRINSGVIFMRNSKAAQSYLTEVIKNGDQEVPDSDKAIYENGHMIKYGKNNPQVKIIDQNKWNNNKKFDPESFIQHYSGGILRGIYLKNQPLAYKQYKFIKQLNLIKRKFFKNPSPTMGSIASLVPFYKEIYPVLSTVREKER